MIGHESLEIVEKMNSFESPRLYLGMTSLVAEIEIE